MRKSQRVHLLRGLDMIVREIKTNTDEVLENFDFFNDYWDTLHWAKYNCKPEIVEKLKAAYDKCRNDGTYFKKPGA